MPERIQRSRRRGWRMPANTVYVGRWCPLAKPCHADVLLEIANEATR